VPPMVLKKKKLSHVEAARLSHRDGFVLARRLNLLIFMTSTQTRAAASPGVGGCVL
jgi:hypothetical protein